LHRIGFPSVDEGGDEAWLLSSIANCGSSNGGLGRRRVVTADYTHLLIYIYILLAWALLDLY